MAAADTVIELRQVATRFGSHVVHDGLDLEVRRAEIFALVGGSGSGKSTLLREMILLQRPDSGSIKVLGIDLATLDDAGATALRQRWGVMFQHGGLFGSLNVRENVGLPLREHTRLADSLIDAVAAWKLALAGLDPDGADGVDELVLRLRDLHGLTIVVITHDLDLLWQVADRVAVLADGKVQGVGSMDELSRLDHPAVRPFFDGPRARAAQTQDRSATSKPR